MGDELRAAGEVAAQVVAVGQQEDDFAVVLVVAEQRDGLGEPKARVRPALDEDNARFERVDHLAGGREVSGEREADARLPGEDDEAYAVASETREDGID